MNRNILYLVIGALAAVAVVLGYQFYRERQKTTGVEISIGERWHFNRKEVVRHGPGDAPTDVSGSMKIKAIELRKDPMSI